MDTTHSAPPTKPNQYTIRTLCKRWILHTPTLLQNTIIIISEHCVRYGYYTLRPSSKTQSLQYQNIVSEMDTTHSDPPPKPNQYTIRRLCQRWILHTPTLLQNPINILSEDCVRDGYNTFRPSSKTQSCTKKIPFCKSVNFVIYFANQVIS